MFSIGYEMTVHQVEQVKTIFFRRYSEKYSMEIYLLDVSQVRFLLRPQFT